MVQNDTIANGSPRLSVLISSGGVRLHLGRLLESLARQKTSVSFEVIIGGAEDSTLADFVRAQRLPFTWSMVLIPELNISHIRNKIYGSARGRWVYFLDEDCSLPPDFLTRIETHLRTAPVRAFAGYYLSPPGSSLWRKTYNSVSNLWLSSHAGTGTSVAFAGNVMLPKVDVPPENFPFHGSTPFGGEEIRLCENLRRERIPLEVGAEFSVYHHTSPTPRRFFSRARLHGQSLYKPLTWRQRASGLRRWCALEKRPLVLTLGLLYLLTMLTARWAQRISPNG